MTTRKLSEPDHKAFPKLIYFTPATAWGIFILYFSLLPGPSIPGFMHDMNDKFIHAGIYFFSALLIYLGFIRFNSKNPITRVHLGFTVLICILFGSAVELLQHFLVANRSGEWSDFLANSTGAAVCVFALHFLHRRRT